MKKIVVLLCLFSLATLSAQELTLERANGFPKELGHLKLLAQHHLNYSLPAIVDGNYEGEHWLASFALLAFDAAVNKE